jgi:hypothetical protein
LLLVGDDWAEDHHDVEVQDETGRRLGRARLPEGIAGITQLHGLIGRFLPGDAAPEQVVVGIETDRGLLVGVAFLLALLFPIRVIEEANPDWRFLSWILALCVVAFSLLALYRAGGMAWLRHFAFPVCFPLAAVPWPVQLENSIVQTMMRGVASIAVEITRSA